jgi:alpha/beta superfamily hydrolase
MTNETPQFFRSRSGQRLFGILHQADTSAVGKQVAVVFCAALFEEKLWSHRVMVNCARFLAKHGISVLRFDYFGDGESEGRFEEASVTSRVTDTIDALRFCREQTDAQHVFVLGLSYGATLAVQAGLREQSAAGVVAWAPVIDGGKYVQDLLRVNLSAQMVVHRRVVHDREALVAKILNDEFVNIEGYELGRQLYLEIVSADVRAILSDATKPTLILQIAPGERVDNQYGWLTEPVNARVQFGLIRQEKFWTQQKSAFPPSNELFNRTRDWLLSAPVH